MVDHWTGGGTVPRDAEGNIIWCDSVAPVGLVLFRRGVAGVPVRCARVLCHDGDYHENGTFRWPRGEDE